MLSVEQLKFVEYLVTGHTVPESSEMAGIASNTARNWLKQADVLQELSRATDVFEKEVTRARARSYRVINKKIVDAILKKIEANALDNFGVDELIKMLNKSVITMREDTNDKKLPALSLQQNNLTINATLQEQFQKQQFVDKFSELLIEMDPNDIQNVAEAKLKADREAQNV